MATIYNLPLTANQVDDVAHAIAYQLDSDTDGRPELYDVLANLNTLREKKENTMTMTRKTRLLYREIEELQQRGPVEPAEPVPVLGTCLVGVDEALEFYTDQSQFGKNRVLLFPAFYDGKRCWLRQAIWCPAPGYSVYGLVEERIIYFETGVKIFLEQGVFNFPLPEQGETQD